MAAPLATLWAELGLDSKKFTEGLKQALQSVDGFGSQFAQAGTALSAAFTLPIGFALKESIEEFSKWQYQTARIAALGGDEFVNSFERIKQASKDMAGNFAATDVARGFAELTAAGYQASEITGMAGASMKLAQIEGTELGKTAVSLSNIMKTYGVSADSANLVTDLLAKTSAMSAISVTDLSVALRYAGPAAGVAGISLKETAAALAILGDAGIRGSSAGTSLRAMLASIENPSRKASKALKDVGISVHDANGNLLPFETILKNMSPLLGNMQQGFAIFGKQFSAISLLLAESKQGFSDRMEDLGKVAGSADKMAKIMENTLVGTWKKINAELKNLFIEAGEVLEPYAAQIGQFLIAGIKHVREFVGWFKGLPEPVKTAALGVVAAVALIGPAMLGLSAIIKGVTFGIDFTKGFFGMEKALIGIGDQLVKAGVSSKIFSVGMDAVKGAVSSTWQTLTKFLTTDIFSGLGKGISGMGAGLAKLPEMIGSAISGIPAAMSGAWSGISAFFVDKWKAIANASVSAYNSTVAAIMNIPSNVSSAFGSLVKSAESMKIGVVAAFGSVKTSILGVVTDIKKIDFSSIWKSGSIAGGFDALGKAFAGLATIATGGLSTALSTIGTAIAGITAPAWATAAAIAAVVAAVGYFIYTRWDQIVAVAKGFWQDMVNLFNWGKDKLVALWNGLVEYYKAVGTTLMKVVEWVFGKGAVDVLVGWANKVKTVIMEAWGAISKFFSSMGTSILSTMASMADSVGLKNTAKALWDWANGTKAADDAMKTLQNTASKPVSTSGIDGIRGAYNSAKDVIHQTTDAVTINGDVMYKTKESYDKVRAQIDKLADAQKNLRKEFESGKISKAEYDELSKAISSANREATTFLARYDTTGDKIEEVNEKLIKSSAKLAKEQAANFASGLLKMRDLADSIPKTMDEMTAKFKNPTEVLTYWDKIEEGFRDATDKGKNLSSMQIAEIRRQADAAQAALLGMAKGSGLVLQNTALEGKTAILEMIAVLNNAKSLGIDWAKDTFVKGAEGIDTFQTKLDDFRARFKKTMEDLKKDGRELDPSKAFKLGMEERTLDLENKLKMPMEQIEAVFRRVTGTTQGLKTALKDVGDSSLSSFTERATRDLQIIQEVAKATGATLDKELSKATQALSSANFTEKVGISLEDLRKQAESLGLSIPRALFGPGVKDSSDSLQSEMELSAKHVEDLRKAFELTGRGAKELFRAEQNDRLVQWAGKSGMSIKELGTILQRAGIDATQFFNTLKEGDFSEQIEDANKALEAATRTFGSLSVQAQQAWSNLLQKGWQKEFNRDINLLRQDLNILGIDLDKLGSRKYAQNFAQTIATMDQALSSFYEKGWLTGQEFMEGMAKRWEYVESVARGYYNQVSIEQDGMSKVFASTWDLAVTTMASSFTRATVEMRKAVSEASIDLGKSLLTFDGDKILSSAKKLGETFLSGMKNAVIAPFQNMFDTLIGGMSEKVSQFVTDKILGLMFKGFESIIGQMPILGSAMGSILGGAGSGVKDLQGMISATSKAAAQTSAAAAQMAKSSAELAKNTAKLAGDGVNLSKAATDVSASAGEAAKAATTATKTVGQAIQSFIGIAGSIGSVISGIMSVFSYFQGKRMEKDIARIEESTRWSKGLLIEIKEILGKGMNASEVVDNLTAVNETLNGRIFELQTKLVEGHSMLQNNIQAAAEILHADLLNILMAMGGEAVNVPEALPAGTFTPAPNNPYNVPQGANFNNWMDMSKLNTAIIGTEEELRNLTGASSSTAREVQKSGVDWSNAFTDNSTAVNNSTAAFDALKASLPDWAQKFSEFTGKSTKDLYEYVKQFGSNLTYASQLVENGTQRVVTDVTTGVRFLVNVADNAIVRILDNTEYVTKEVARNLGDAGDAAVTTAGAFSEASSSLRETTQDTARSFASIVDPASKATNNLANAANGAAAALNAVADAERPRLAMVQAPVVTQVQQPQEPNTAGVSRGNLLDREGNPVGNYAPVPAFGGLGNAIADSFRGFANRSAPAPIVNVPPPTVINEETGAIEPLVETPLYPEITMPEMPAAPVPPLLPPLAPMASERSSNFSGTINIYGVTDPRTAGDSTIEALRQHGVDI